MLQAICNLPNTTSANYVKVFFVDKPSFATPKTLISWLSEQQIFILHYVIGSKEKHEYSTLTQLFLLQTLLQGIPPKTRRGRPR